jgi:hypothetical protein
VRKFSAIAAAVALALGVGCGDDEETLTKAEFIEQADAICAAGNEELNSLEPDFGADKNPAEIVDSFVSEELVPVLQAEHDDIEALGAPEGDEAEVESLLASLQGAIDAAEEDPMAFVISDDAFAEADQAAEAYGLKECGQG